MRGGADGTTTAPRVWIQELGPRPPAREQPPRPASAELVLYCFPYAGGSSTAYYAWHALVPPGVSVRGVQLPGRLDRIDSTPFATASELVAAAADAIAADAAASPFVLFGHSMGALIAY